MIWLAALAVAMHGMTLPPIVGPIRTPGETFEVSVSRSAGFSVPPILAPLRGAEVLGAPRVTGVTATWRVRATGGACELRCYALAPQDAAFIRVPVLLDVPPLPPPARPSRPARTAKPRAGFAPRIEPHLLLANGMGVRFVESTVGPGVLWVRDGRVVGSFAPVLMLEGNSLGAPDRVIRLLPDYRYVAPSPDRAYVRFLGDALDMWKLDVVFRCSPKGFEAEVFLLPRFDGRIARLGVLEWDERNISLRAGEPIRVHLTVPSPR